MASEVLSHIINVLMVSSIYVLVALGFALVFSVMRIMNFAHGAIYMIGGFVCYSFWVPLGLGPWISLPITMAVTGLFGLAIEKLCFRPFRKDFEKATIMAIALVIILKTGADLTVGPHGKSMPPLVSGNIAVGSVVFGADRLMVLLIACILLTLLMLFVRKTKVGQAMLAIGRALMGKPKLLLMDEPSLGLAPILVDELAPVIRNINALGVGVILVEQNVPLALKVADRGYVLHLGKILQEGTKDELKGSEAVKRAYLGE